MENRTKKVEVSGKRNIDKNRNKKINSANNANKTNKPIKYNNKNKMSKKVSTVIFKNRFYIIIVVVFVLIMLSISLKLVLSSIKTQTVFDNNMDVTSVNISKEAQKIKTQYESEGQKDRFVTEYDKIQSAIGAYAIDNTTLDKNSFKDIIKNINNILSKSDWSKLNLEKSNYWAGKWSIDDSAKLSFKFSKKEIEPNWINDQDVADMIVKN